MCKRALKKSLRGSETTEAISELLSKNNEIATPCGLAMTTQDTFSETSVSQCIRFSNTGRKNEEIYDLYDGDSVISSRF